jgi:NitT/TauT family transport system ATP-binding protein
MTGVHVQISSKSFRGNKGQSLPVIGEVDFKVRSGEFVCLFGPSGTGKTTMLNSIAGIDREFDGRIDIKGSPKVGYVFQEPRLLPWLTVRQNIELVVAETPELTEDVDVLLHRVGLSDFAETYPERLSLGMARRVAIARAFVVKPDILLLDEPFVSLDAENASRLRTLLSDLWASRPTTTLFVTHDMRDAVELADRILFFTPRPARLSRDVSISLPRPRVNMDEVIEKMAKELAASNAAEL